MAALTEARRRMTDDELGIPVKPAESGWRDRVLVGIIGAVAAGIGLPSNVAFFVAGAWLILQLQNHRRRTREDKLELAARQRADREWIAQEYERMRARATAKGDGIWV